MSKLVAICLSPKGLTHLPLVRIYASVNKVSIGLDNGLWSIWHQAIILTTAGLSSIAPLETKFGGILTKIQKFSLTKLHLKTTSAN